MSASLPTTEMVMPQPIFFAHANGFPSATYGKLFAALAPDYDVSHVACQGHDPRFPVDDNWRGLVDELLHHVQGQPAPVWGVGHSLGGVLHLHAAMRRPDLYRGVIMLDSPVFTRVERWLIRGAKQVGLIDRITPAGRTLGRRASFPDPETARRYFSSKALFQGFDPECLDAYLEHGLAQAAQGWQLRFDPATEIGIYRSVPHELPMPGRPLDVPVAMISGRQSRVVRPRHALAVRALPKGEYHAVPGGHMFPLERPVDTASLIKGLCDRWSQA